VRLSTWGSWRRRSTRAGTREVMSISESHHDRALRGPAAAVYDRVKAPIADVAIDLLGWRFSDSCGGLPRGAQGSWARAERRSPEPARETLWGEDAPVSGAAPRDPDQRSLLLFTGPGRGFVSGLPSSPLQPAYHGGPASRSSRWFAGTSHHTVRGRRRVRGADLLG